MPKVSVIVPVYGVEKFISQCAASLMEQTLHDVEFIFIDDCTPDASMARLTEVLDRYPHRRHQIKICRNESNLGQALTRRKGIMMAKGDYVIHCDPDDWVESGWLEKLYGATLRNNADIAWCGFENILADGSSKYYANRAADNIEDFMTQLETGRKWGSLCLHLVKREIAQSANIAWPDWNYCEDLSLIFQYGAMAQRVTFVEGGFYKYRCNAESITMQRNRRGIITKVEGEIKASLQGLEVCRRIGFGRKHRANILARIFRAKSRLYAAATDAKDYCKLWHSGTGKFRLTDVFASTISMKEKIVTAAIFLKVYPLLKK